MDKLGTTIKHARKQRGITQGQLAAALGMSRATISGLENGTFGDLGIRKVEAVLNYLGLTLTPTLMAQRPTFEQLTGGNGFHD